VHLSKPKRPSRLSPWLNSVQRPHKSQHKLAPEPAVSRLNPKVFKRHLFSPCAPRELPFPHLHIAFGQFVASPPAKERRSSRGEPSGGENALSPRRLTAPRLRQQPVAPTSQSPACGLTLRSAATPHGKPLGRRGTFAYAAPRRPSALPRGSRLAQTLGVTNLLSRGLQPKDTMKFPPLKVLVMLVLAPISLPLLGQTSTNEQESVRTLEATSQDCRFMVSKLMGAPELRSIVGGEAESRARICECFTRRMESDKWLNERLGRTSEPTGVIMKSPLGDYVFGRAMASLFNCMSLELEAGLTKRQSAQ
jgi:hypothetical protein